MAGVCVAAAAGVLTPAPAGALGESIGTDPTSGVRNSTFTLLGSGFAANTTVTFTWREGANNNALPTNPATVKADATGTFTATAQVPAAAALGDHTITANWQPFSQSTTTVFTVTASPPPPTTTTTAPATTTTTRASTTTTHGSGGTTSTTRSGSSGTTGTTKPGTVVTTPPGAPVGASVQVGASGNGSDVLGVELSPDDTTTTAPDENAIGKPFPAAGGSGRCHACWSGVALGMVAIGIGAGAYHQRDRRKKARRRGGPTYRRFR
jgi:hypothetical protein